MSDYNGWKNWETWNTNLWFDNDPCLYPAKQAFLNEHAKRGGKLRPETVKSFIREMLPFGTPDMNRTAEYRLVDWAEIAETWDCEIHEMWLEEQEQEQEDNPVIHLLNLSSIF